MLHSAVGLARNPGSIGFLRRPEASGVSFKEEETWEPMVPCCFFSQSFLLGLGEPPGNLKSFHLSATQEKVARLRDELESRVNWES